MSRRYRYAVLGVATLANLAQVATRVVVSPLVPRLLADFDVSTGVVGALLTGMWALFALSHYPSGVLAERFGSRRVIAAALAVTVAAGLALAAAPSVGVFAAALLVLGVGTGLYFVVGTGYVADHFPDRTAQMLGVHSAGAGLAGLAVPVLAVAVAARSSWRVSIAGVALLVAVALAAFVAVTRPGAAAKPDVALREALRPGDRLAVVRRPAVLWPLGVVVVAAFAWQAVVSFLPTFLVESRALSEALAATLFSLTFVANAVGLPVVGRVSDRVGTQWGVVLCLVALLGGVATLLSAGSVPTLAAGAAVVGFGMSYGGAVQSLFLARFAEADRVSGFGAVRSVYMLLGSLGSVVTGTLAGWLGWDAAFGALGGLLVVALAVALYWAARVVPAGEAAAATG